MVKHEFVVEVMIRMIDMMLPKLIVRCTKDIEIIENLRGSMKVLEREN